MLGVPFWGNIFDKTEENFVKSEYSILSVCWRINFHFKGAILKWLSWHSLCTLSYDFWDILLQLQIAELSHMKKFRRVVFFSFFMKITLYNTLVRKFKRATKNTYRTRIILHVRKWNLQNIIILSWLSYIQNAELSHSSNNKFTWIHKMFGIRGGEKTQNIINSSVRKFVRSKVKLLLLNENNSLNYKNVFL